jgi:YrbI family 3-deoxy-D-manno-octulosonate 8-phosphate phosphatase
MENNIYSDISYLVMDFDGVMTDDGVYINDSGIEMVRCSRFDGAGISLLKNANSLGYTNIEMLILSSETNKVALERAGKLGIDCEINVNDKFSFLCDRATQSLHLSPEVFFSKTIYLGNDLNDLNSMVASKYSMAPDNAHVMIKQAADIVLLEKGGHGFVRAAIEIILGRSLIEALVKDIYV